MKKIRNLILFVIFVFLFIAITYLKQTYPTISMEVESETRVLINDNISIETADNANSNHGIIMYPGGQVEATAYVQLLEPFALEGYRVIIAAMPFNLAVFSPNIAQEIIEDYPTVDEWHIIGHSLGGAMAASFVASHPEKIESITMLSAYTTKSLTDFSGKVLSIRASEDLVLNQKSYDKNFMNLPKQTKEVMINGGNHAQFGNYGVQKKDGNAKISQLEQIEITQEYIRMMLSE